MSGVSLSPSWHFPILLPPKFTNIHFSSGWLRSSDLRDISWYCQIGLSRNRSRILPNKSRTNLISKCMIGGQVIRRNANLVLRKRDLRSSPKEKLNLCIYMYVNIIPMQQRFRVQILKHASSSLCSAEPASTIQVEKSTGCFFLTGAPLKNLSASQ